MKFLAVGLILWGFSVPVMALELRGKFEQGGLIRGQTEPGAVVSVGERKVRVSVNGVFIIGFTRDASEREILSIRLPDGTMSEQTLAIKPRVYDIQRIDGLPPRMVTPPESVLARIKRENAKIHAVRMNDRAEPFFEKGWVWPAKGRISGVYGSQRILNGKPKWPHYGIDIAAKKGTIIRSSGAGVVTMAENDLYYTGGTIIMDHGHAISSIYSHLDKLKVKVGDQVQQGDMIGTVGSTGRSTGPHLDFRINWFQTRLDPMSILN